MRSFVVVGLASLSLLGVTGACSDDPASPGAPTASSSASSGGGSASTSSGASTSTSSSTSSSSGGDDGGGGEVTATAIVEAQCAYSARCSPELIVSLGDVAKCRSAFAGIYASLAALPGAKLTRAAVDACAAKVNAATCDDNVDFAECRFAGTLPAGAGCFEAIQCAGKACVKQGAGIAECGKCGVPGAVGQDCSAGEAACDLGLECSNPENKCVARVPKDGACSPSTPSCAVGLYCRSGKCVPPTAKGGACGPGLAPCAAPLECNFTDKCVEPAPLKTTDIGGSCPLDAAGVRVHCKGSYCREQKKCAAYKKLGETCDSGIDRCEFPAFCTGGVCKTDGMTCP